eukprot:3547193-Amphidinium_carterae.1
MSVFNLAVSLVCLKEHFFPMLHWRSWKLWQHSCDLVEAFDLESNQGKSFNGQLGVVLSYSEEKERFEVQFAHGVCKFLKASNLRLANTAAQAGV